MWFLLFPQFSFHFNEYKILWSRSHVHSYTFFVSLPGNFQMSAIFPSPCVKVQSQTILFLGTVLGAQRAVCASLCFHWAFWKFFPWAVLNCWVLIRGSRSSPVSWKLSSFRTDTHKFRESVLILRAAGNCSSRWELGLAHGEIRYAKDKHIS